METNKNPKYEIPEYDPYTGELNPYYRELTSKQTTMNKEQQELVGDAYKNYFIKKSSETGPFGIAGIIPTKEEFINKIKTDTKFSEKWGLKIEERELSLEERNNVYKKQWEPGASELSHDRFNSLNIPTKLITVTYNDTIIESYEN